MQPKTGHYTQLPGNSSALGIVPESVPADFLVDAGAPRSPPYSKISWGHSRISSIGFLLVKITGSRNVDDTSFFLVLGLSGAEKDAYISGAPADDVRFVGAFAHALEHTGGYKPEEAKRVAKTLLPEVLRYDPMQPTSFPDNGRSLTDDAVDVFLTYPHKWEGDGG